MSCYLGWGVTGRASSGKEARRAGGGGAAAKPVAGGGREGGERVEEWGRACTSAGGPVK